MVTRNDFECHLNLGYLHTTGPETSTLISISLPHPEVHVTVKFVSTLLLSDATSYVTTCEYR